MKGEKGRQIPMPSLAVRKSFASESAVFVFFPPWRKDLIENRGPLFFPSYARSAALRVEGLASQAAAPSENSVFPNRKLPITHHRLQRLRCREGSGSSVQRNCAESSIPMQCSHGQNYSGIGLIPVAGRMLVRRSECGNNVGTTRGSMLDSLRVRLACSAIASDMSQNLFPSGS